MIPNEFETAIYASLAGFVVGGVMKLITKFLERDKTELDMHVTLRKELREELDTVKKDLHRLQSEVDEWKQKYFRYHLKCAMNQPLVLSTFPEIPTCKHYIPRSFSRL